MCIRKGLNKLFVKSVLFFFARYNRRQTLLLNQYDSYSDIHISQYKELISPRGGVLGSRFAGYVPLASQSPYPIIVYSVASYRPHLSHFWANVIVISRTELNASRLLNIKTTAGTNFEPRIFLFLNPCLPKFSYSKNPENLRPYSSNSTENVTPF